jgi:hypothetical protein
MLLSFDAGGYRFLKGGFPYSRGVVAGSGFAIEHVRLAASVALAAGFDIVARYLEAIGRPRTALCAMELRSPQPFTFEGFREFNSIYVAVLESWGIVRDGLNPVARTNVAPEVNPPAEPSLYGFSYTVPASAEPPSFVVSGAGELPEGARDPMDVVRRGDTSPDAIAEKARFVIGLMEQRLAGLGVDWRDATATQIYTVHNVHPFLERELAARTATPHGFTWHYARPPIVTIEYEMDVRGCRREVVIG